MKRISITVTLILLSIVVTLSQNTTPTKEETLKWISEKINLYGSNITDGNTKIKYEVTDNLVLSLTYDNYGVKDYFLLSLADIAKFNVSNNTVFLNTKGNKVIGTTHDGDHVYNSGLMLELDWFAEPDLKTRFTKAMEALVKYNLESFPKESY